MSHLFSFRVTGWKDYPLRGLSVRLCVALEGFSHLMGLYSFPRANVTKWRGTDVCLTNRGLNLRGRSQGNPGALRVVLSRTEGVCGGSWCMAASTYVCF